MLGKQLYQMLTSHRNGLEKAKFVYIECINEFAFSGVVWYVGRDFKNTFLLLGSVLLILLSFDFLINSKCPWMHLGTWRAVFTFTCIFRTESSRGEESK